jgi:isopenicillin N synthase-like dioxygenase
MSQDILPELIGSPLPLVDDKNQDHLSKLGWTPIAFAPPNSGATAAVDTTELCPPQTSPHPLLHASEALLANSQKFFDQSVEEKKRWENWRKIPGEKEYIILQTLEDCPDILRESAKMYWDWMRKLLEDTLESIECSLDMKDCGSTKGKQLLRQFIGPCNTMPTRQKDKTASLLQLFRYDSCEVKQLTEHHVDSGLLTVVLGNIPGLEVWGGDRWFEIEKEIKRSGKKEAIMLVGRDLQRLSNGRYPAGLHRVVSYGVQEPSFAGTESPSMVSPLELISSGNNCHRLSIVFSLRAHGPTIINSDELETLVTGAWPQRTNGVTAADWFKDDCAKYYDINSPPEEREEARKKQQRDILRSDKLIEWNM